MQRSVTSERYLQKNTRELVSEPKILATFRGNVLEFTDDALGFSLANYSVGSVA